MDGLPRRQIPIHKHTKKCVMKRRRQIQSLRGYSVFRSTDSLRDVYEGHCLRCCCLCALRLCCIWLPDPHIHPLFRKKIRVANQRAFLRRTDRSCSCTYLGNETNFSEVMEERDPNSIQVRFADVDTEDMALEADNNCSDFVYYDNPSRYYRVNSQYRGTPEENFDKNRLYSPIFVRHQNNNGSFDMIDKPREDCNVYDVVENFEEHELFPRRHEDFLETTIEEGNFGMHTDRGVDINCENIELSHIPKLPPIGCERSHGRLPPKMNDELLMERRIYWTDHLRKMQANQNKRPAATFQKFPKEHVNNEFIVNQSEELSKNNDFRNTVLDNGTKRAMNPRRVSRALPNINIPSKRENEKLFKNPLFHVDPEFLPVSPTSILIDNFSNSSSLFDKKLVPQEMKRPDPYSNIIISKLTRYIAHILYNLFSLNVTLEVTIDLLNDLILTRGKNICVCKERSAVLERSKEYSRHIMDNIFRMYFSPRTGTLAYLDLPESSVMFHDIRDAALNLTSDYYDAEYKNQHKRSRLKRKIQIDAYKKHTSNKDIPFDNKLINARKASVKQLRKNIADVYKENENDLKILEEEIVNENILVHDINRNLPSTHNNNTSLSDQYDREFPKQFNQADANIIIRNYYIYHKNKKEAQDALSKLKRNEEYNISRETYMQKCLPIFKQSDNTGVPKNKNLTEAKYTVTGLGPSEITKVPLASNDEFITMLHATHQARKDFAVALDHTVQFIEKMRKVKRNSGNRYLRSEMRARLDYLYSLSQTRALIYIRCIEKLKRMVGSQRRQRDSGA